MTSRILTSALLLPMAVLAADQPKFNPGAITDYPNRQTVEQITIAARAYATPELARQAFGKLDPNRYGVLPVLVLMENAGDKTISLADMRVEYLMPDRRRVEATPASDVRYIQGPERPGVVTGPIPGGKPRLSRRKNPLDVWEIEGRAFAARALPPHQSASGFFYFQAPYRKGAILFVTGLREAGTGRELFFFEIPLDEPAPNR
ncbi:MAG: hypothetical protein ACP5U2_02140 [Bryobacteraceae bacterium]